MEKQIYLWVINGLFTVVTILFWARIKRIEKDIDENKNKSTSIEKNYLTRFEKLHNKLADVERNIIREIFEVRMAAVSSQQSVISSQHSETQK